MLALGLWCRCGIREAGQWLRPAVRVLLLLTTVLILVMPVTECVWNFDGFLHGGSDVEFTLLAGLLFAAMVVLSIERSMRPPLLALLLCMGATLHAMLCVVAGRLFAGLTCDTTAKFLERSALAGGCLCPASLTPLRI